MLHYVCLISSLSLLSRRSDILLNSLFLRHSHLITMTMMWILFLWILALTLPRILNWTGCLSLPLLQMFLVTSGIMTYL